MNSSRSIVLSPLISFSVAETKTDWRDRISILDSRNLFRICFYFFCIFFSSWCMPIYFIFGTKNIRAEIHIPGFNWNAETFQRCISAMQLAADITRVVKGFSPFAPWRARKHTIIKTSDGPLWNIIRLPTRKVPLFLLFNITLYRMHLKLIQTNARVSYGPK